VLVIGEGLPKARVDFCELGCTRPSAPCSPFDVRPRKRRSHEATAKEKHVRFRRAANAALREHVGISSTNV